MARGLGFADTPQTTSPANPSTGDAVRRRRGPQPNAKYTQRRTPYYWMMQENLPSYGYGEYGYGLNRRGKNNNDTGSTPGAYLNFIER